MPNIQLILEKVTERQLIYCLATLGFLLAVISNYIQHGWINVDSLLYFESARLISIGEWKQAIAIYNWPFYSAIIALLHKVTGISIQYSAQVWNVLFYTITVFSFSKLIQLAGGGKLTMACGVFLLVSSPYISGSVLPMLLRDQGFWAAYLTSVVFFIQFYRTQKTSDALLWQLSVIIAVLFRIEAISYLALLPVTLLLNKGFTFNERIKQFLKINLIPAVGFILLFVAVLLIPSISLDDFGRLHEVFRLLTSQGAHIADAFNSKAGEMAKLLGQDLDEFGLFGVIVTLLAIFILKVLKLISLPVIGLYILTHRQVKAAFISWQMKQDAQMIFSVLLAISSMNALASITRSFVLSGRYIIAIGLITFIFGAFCLAQLIQSLQSNLLSRRSHKIILFMIVTVLSVTLINNFKPKEPGYNHEREAVDYIQSRHIQMDQVYYTTQKTIYYAGLPYHRGCNGIWECIEKAIRNGSIFNYPYLLIYVDIDKSVGAKEKLLKDELKEYQLEKEFYGLNNKKKLMFFTKKN